MCFGNIWARQLEHSIGGLQSQGYCVERLSLLLIYVEAVEIFFMLMRDNVLHSPSTCSCQRQETRCSSAGCPPLQMPPRTVCPSAGCPPGQSD